MADQLPVIFGTQKSADHWLRRYEKRMGQMLAARIPPERWIETAMLAVRSPGRYNDYPLLHCSTLSVLGALFEAAQLGLVLGDVRGQCYLIPRNCRIGEGRSARMACFQMGYRGYIVLGKRAEAIIRAQCVYRSDRFEINFGADHPVMHIPNFKYPRVRENLIGTYALIRYVNGVKDAEFLNLGQIEKRRKCSKAPAGDSPWDEWYEEMGRKSAIHALGKRSGLTDMQHAAVLDERGMLGLPQGTVERAAQVLELDTIPPEQLEAPEGDLQPPQQTEAPEPPREPGSDDD